MLTIFYCASQKNKIKKLLDSPFIPRGIEVKTIALPCLAKLEVIHLLKAIEIGARGVTVWGCGEEDCLYPPGSIVGRGRFAYAQRVLKEIRMENFLLSYFGDGLENSAEMEKQFNNWLKKGFPAV